MIETEQTDWRRLLTLGERARMLQDIARVSLAAGTRLFPEQPWSDLAVSEGTRPGPKSPVEQLGFIEHVLPLLSQAVQQIGRDPLAKAVSVIHSVSPPIRARRVGTPALLEAVRRGPSLRTLDETITVLSLDTPENRAVHSFLRLLLRDSVAIGQIAESEGEGEIIECAESCARRLRGLLAMPWWEGVGLDKGNRVPPVIQRPEYRRVFHEKELYRREFQFDWTHPRLKLPPRDTWRLYETWCLFTVLKALMTLGFAPATSDLFTIKEGRLTLTLATDAASQIAMRSGEGKKLLVTYNQTFAEGRNSLSHTMQPDIVLASEDCRWILDAKFKAYTLPGEEGSDINQMHAYRDAIINDAGRRNVVCAWCLYAGSADIPNRPCLTYGRAEEAAVGALCLRPGNEATLTNLRELLGNWLRKQ